MVQSVDYIDRRQLKMLSRLKPWKTALAIATDWAIIIFTIVFGTMMSHWLVWLVGVAVIAGRMHALGAMMHDFTHYRFIRNKALSDWIGDIFLAWPLGTTVASFRYNHLTHHRYANTDKDPDWTSKQGNKIYTFPQEMRLTIANFLGYFIMISSIRDIKGAFVRLQKEETPSKVRLAARVAYNVAIPVAVIYFGVLIPYVLYWLVPFFTLFFLFLYVRSVAEHCGETMDYTTELSGTRTVIPHFWERWFFCPHNINYHAEHHLYPSVPYYNLPALSDALMGNKKFTGEAHLTRGYLTGLFREVWLNSWWPDKGASVGADAAK